MRVVELFVWKIALTFYPDRILGQDFLCTNALCDFLSIGHVFEWIPIFEKSVGLYLLRGGQLRAAPPLCEDLCLSTLKGFPESQQFVILFFYKKIDLFSKVAQKRVSTTFEKTFF